MASRGKKSLVFSVCTFCLAGFLRDVRYFTLAVENADMALITKLGFHQVNETNLSNIDLLKTELGKPTRIQSVIPTSAIAGDGL